MKLIKIILKTRFYARLREKGNLIVMNLPILKFSSTLQVPNKLFM